MTGRYDDVRDAVHRLAAAHSVEYQETAQDRWADAITRLSYDDVVLDDTELLLIELARRGFITGDDAVQMQLQYLRQKIAGENDVEKLR